MYFIKQFSPPKNIIKMSSQFEKYLIDKIKMYTISSFIRLQRNFYPYPFFFFLIVTLKS